MSHDQPDIADLVRTVRDFVDGVVPKLDGRERYHALCAVYLLEVVERELGEWQHRETADDQRVRQLIKAPDAPLEALAGRLGADIRAGRFDHEMDELLQALTEHVAAKVRVSRPSSLEPEHR